MKKKIKIITTSDQGGLLDFVNIINDGFKKRGYKSSIIKINKFKKQKKINIKKNDYVIFQMSQYGYQYKGIPFWLINQFKKIRFKASNIIIHFHELNVVHNVWNPRFIIMILQKYINKRLLSYCDYWVTSNKEYANWLNKYLSNKKNSIIPVISNINHKIKRFKKNKNIVVLFGTWGSRIIIYRKYFSIINNWITKNNLTLYDVGTKIKDTEINNLLKNNKNINICGRLSVKNLRNLLSKTYFGIFSTKDSLIDKSGVFAAYSLFRICPINFYKFDEKGKKKFNQRLIKFAPENGTIESHIKKIQNNNFEISKNIHVDKYIKIYLKNY